MGMRFRLLRDNRYYNPKCAVCTASDDVIVEIDKLDDSIEKILKRIGENNVK
jgi:hypothetical protein